METDTARPATFPSLREQAGILLQEFAEDKVLKKGWLRRADKSRGKFLGVVLLAREASTGSSVAIKMIKSELAGDELRHRYARGSGFRPSNTALDAAENIYVTDSAASVVWKIPR